MTLDARTREQVRQRANYACEYCDVSETDSGGLLTIDHFQPRSKGGDGALENLFYCCLRCNQYKMDYWPTASGTQHLWHPRTQPATEYFLELEDGTLCGLTATGSFSVQCLRLNRTSLVAYRLRKQQLVEKTRLLAQYRGLVVLQEKLLNQQSNLLTEQHRLLAEQRQYLDLLINHAKQDK